MKIVTSTKLEILLLSNLVSKLALASPENLPIILLKVTDKLVVKFVIEYGDTGELKTLFALIITFEVIGVVIMIAE